MNIGFRFFDGTTDWAWVRSRLPILQVEDTGGLVAYDEDTGEPQAACMWDNWTHTTVQVHLLIVNNKVLKNGFLEEVADYLFNHKERTAIYGFVPGDNFKALRMNTRIGFTVKSVLEDGVSKGVDYIILELKKENCQFMPEKVEELGERHG